MKKLFVLFICLFVMVNGAVFAQENDDEKDGSQDVVTGSVSSSEFYYVPTSGKPGEIQPMYQNHGVNSWVGLVWQWHYVFSCSIWGGCRITASAGSQIVGTVPPITICAEVTSFLKNGGNQGSSGQHCWYNTTSGSVNPDKTVNGDPRGATWVANTSHIIIGSGIYDNPHLQASVSL
jgi:hypothetical protein